MLHAVGQRGSTMGGDQCGAIGVSRRENRTSIDPRSFAIVARMANKPRTSSPRMKAARSDIALPSATLPTADLIDAGSRFNLERLLTHAESVLGKIDHPGFASYGFDGVWRTGMEHQITKTRACAAEVEAGRENAMPSGEHLDAVVGRAKSWRRVASAAVSIIPGAMHLGHGPGTGTSVPALITSIGRLTTPVKKAPRTPEGTGIETSLKGTALIAELKDAQKAHKLALKKLPPVERALHEAKGLLYEELKRVARIARTEVPTESKDFAPTTHLLSRRRTPHHETPATTSVAPTSKTA